MRTKTVSCLIILCTLLTLGCKTTGLNSGQKKKQFQKMQWIEGTWEYTCAEYSIYEYWKSINDTLLEGRSILTIVGDTSLDEQLSITANGINIFYNTHSKSTFYENSDSYLLVKNTGKKMIFEDKGNVQQSRISYLKKKGNVMIVIVDGTDNDRSVSEQYTMNKMK